MKPRYLPQLVPITIFVAVAGCATSPSGQYQRTTTGISVSNDGATLGNSSTMVNVAQPGHATTNRQSTQGIFGKTESEMTIVPLQGQSPSQ